MDVHARERRNISERNGWLGRGRRMGKEMWEIRKVLGEGCTSPVRVAAFRRGMREKDEREVDRVRCVRGENGVVVRSFVREGSVLGSRNMA